MKLPEFKLERFQSLFEHEVSYNLSDSGVHPISMNDLLGEGDLERLANLPLAYAQTNGPALLRERVAHLYGAAPGNVLITNGTIEANLLCAWQLFDPGSRLVYMLPNYVQYGGLAEAFGVAVAPFYLHEGLNWQPDLDELEALDTADTRVIALVNPNNPTGAVLSETAMDKLVSLAEKVGAWLLVDEIYRGTEHSGSLTPTFWGRYDKTIITGSLSKAYGLPGLRIGWVVGPEDFVAEAWSYKDYTSITAATLSYELATLALAPDTQKRILGRNLAHVRENLDVLQAWIAEHPAFSLTPPSAAAMAFMGYDLPLDSVALGERLRRDKSVLVVPGAYFGMENFIRLGYGAERDKFEAALELIRETVDELTSL